VLESCFETNGRKAKLVIDLIILFHDVKFTQTAFRKLVSSPNEIRAKIRENTNFWGKKEGRKKIVHSQFFSNSNDSISLSVINNQLQEEPLQTTSGRDRKKKKGKKAKTHPE